MDEPERAVMEMEPELWPERRRPPWELLLGLLLVVGVLGYAAVDWGRTEYLAQHYQRGRAAAEARHWDAAVAGFAAAEGYQDAARWLANAQEQVRQRDSLLVQARDATTPGDAWRALAALELIEPDYPDIARRLRNARERLFAGGMAGSIYLQTTGSPPGLYLLRYGVAEYLPGSDAQSRVRGVASGGTAFLYDAPAADLRGGCLLPCRQGDRVIMLVRFGAAGEQATRPVGGELDPAGSGIFTRDGSGFWWTARDDVRYVDLDQPQLANPLAARPGWRVLAVDPAQKHILLAAPPRAAVGNTLLYLATAAGQEARQLQNTASGTVLNAAFSADGNHLVYEGQQIYNEVTRSLWQMDLRMAEPALAGVEWLTWQQVHSLVRLNAFLLPAPAAYRLLVDRIDMNGEEIAAFDLRTGGRRVLWSGPGQELGYDTAAVSPDGRYLAFYDPHGQSGTLVLASLAGADPPRTFPCLTADGYTIHVAFAPRGDYLLYEVRDYTDRVQVRTKPLYTVPTAAAAGTVPRQVITAAQSADPTLPTVALPPSGDLLLYVTVGGALYATTFDGAANQLQATGVAAVWSLRDPSPWAWAR